MHLPAWDSGLLMGLSRRHTPGSCCTHCTRTARLIVLQYWNLKMESAKDQVHVMTSTDATTLLLSSPVLNAQCCTSLNSIQSATALSRCNSGLKRSLVL